MGVVSTLSSSGYIYKALLEVLELLLFLKFSFIEKASGKPSSTHGIDVKVICHYFLRSIPSHCLGYFRGKTIYCSVSALISLVIKSLMTLN